MLKLYKKLNQEYFYWETWKDGDVHIIHYGTIGDKGITNEIKDSKKVQELIQQKNFEGYNEIDDEDQYYLEIEYEIDGKFGNEQDLDKRYDLEDRLNNTLGWTGLGCCDGGSIGMGTMEVGCIVIDLELAKKIIKEDLKNTEFADYSRIHGWKMNEE